MKLENAVNAKRILYVTLIGIGLFCWYLIYQSHEEEYDSNYGAFLLSLFISFITTLFVIYAEDRGKISKTFMLTFLIVNSPVSLICFIKFFAFISDGFFQ